MKEITSKNIHIEACVGMECESKEERRNEIRWFSQILCILKFKLSVCVETETDERDREGGSNRVFICAFIWAMQHKWLCICGWMLFEIIMF